MNILTAVTTGAVDLENISILNAAIVAGLGYLVVFVGLIALMAVVIALGKYFQAAEAKAKAAAAAAPAAAAPAAPAAAPAAAPVVNAEPAPGSAGKLKLHDVEPKTAAMLMAIVANKMGKPINELRFISIKEVK